MTLVNAECRLAARPVGLPKPSDWDVIETPVADLADGEFLVGVEYVSIDPAMRTWMNAGRSYVPPVEIGEVMRAGGIGQIIDSRHPDFAVGEQVYGVFVARASMTGSVIFDYADRYAEGVAQLAKWWHGGELRSHEQVIRGGVEDFPATLLALFRGENIGKMVLALDGDH